MKRFCRGGGDNNKALAETCITVIINGLFAQINYKFAMKMSLHENDNNNDSEFITRGPMIH